MSQAVQASQHADHLERASRWGTDLDSSSAKPAHEVMNFARRLRDVIAAEEGTPSERPGGNTPDTPDGVPRRDRSAPDADRPEDKPAEVPTVDAARLELSAPVVGWLDPTSAAVQTLRAPGALPRDGLAAPVPGAPDPDALASEPPDAERRAPSRARNPEHDRDEPEITRPNAVSSPSSGETPGSRATNPDRSGAPASPGTATTHAESWPAISNSDVRGAQSTPRGVPPASATSDAVASTQHAHTAHGSGPQRGNSADGVRSIMPSLQGTTSRHAGRSGPAPRAAVEAPRPGPFTTGESAVDQIGRGLASVLKQGGGSVVIRVTPESIGPVRVQLELDRSKVSASFDAESTEARRLLFDHAAELRASLEARGLHVERLEVGGVAVDLGPSAPAGTPVFAFDRDEGSRDRAGAEPRGREGRRGESREGAGYTSEVSPAAGHGGPGVRHDLRLDVTV